MRTLASTRLTHHWYVPYAPYPLIRACAPTRLYPFSCLLTNTVVSVAPLQKCFEFSVLDQIHPFWVNLVQKTKIVSLSWNLVPVLIWISTIQWWCSVFPFLTENVHLGRGGGTNLVQKIKITSLSWNLVPGLIQICTIQWRYWLYLFLTRNTLFRQIWSKKPKLSV